MTAQKTAGRAQSRPEPASATPARKAWVKKTPVDVVLDQIDKQGKKVQELEAQLTKEKREFQKLDQAKKVLQGA